jgi:hypothetical protein
MLVTHPSLPAIRLLPAIDLHLHLLHAIQLLLAIHLLPVIAVPRLLLLFPLDCACGGGVWRRHRSLVVWKGCRHGGLEAVQVLEVVEVWRSGGRGGLEVVQIRKRRGLEIWSSGRLVGMEVVEVM